MRICLITRICFMGFASLALVQAAVVDSTDKSNLRDTRDTRISSYPQTIERTGENRDALQRSVWLSELAGMKVRDSQNQEIGTVDNVLIDLSRGTTPYAIVNTRQGFLGFGSRSAAIPTEHFRRSPDLNYLELDISKDRLSSFPQTDGKSRDKEQWNQLTREYRQSRGDKDSIRSTIVDTDPSLAMVRRGDDIINQSIFSAANERLGQVKDFLVQLEKGVALLASVQLVESDKTVAIPPSLFLRTPAGEDLQVSTTVDRLSAAPSVDISGRNLSEELISLYRYFEVQPSAALASLLQETGSALQSGSDRVAARSRADRERDRDWDREDNETISQPRSGSSTDRYSAANRSDLPADSESDRTRGDDRISFPAESQTRSQRVERQESSRELRADNFLWNDQMKGKEVRNYQGKSLGSIEDLVLNLDNDVVTHAVLSQGGVLGIGGKRIAVPVSLLRTGENTAFFLIDMSERELNRAPQLDKDTWRQGGRERWLESVNDYYREMFPRLDNQSSRMATRNQQRSLGYALLSDFLGKPVQYAEGGSAGEIRDIQLDLSQGRLLNVLISPDSNPSSWRSYSVREVTAQGPDRFFVNSSRSTRDTRTDSDDRLDSGRQPVRDYDSERNR